MQESGVDLSLVNNAYDAIEAHQALEQRRLLQRFKELRQWQQQQQEQLMQQQQLQLKAWQDEQHKVQKLIATQRVGTWNPAGKQKSGELPLVTPPRKQPTDSVTSMMDSCENTLTQTVGISEDSGVASMQNTLKSQGTLPKPIMYIDPNNIHNLQEEDRYTSSELFSNPGSHEDQMDILKEDTHLPIPDWMSDSSENFVPLKLPPPRPTLDGTRNGDFADHLAGLDQLLSTVPPGILQQVLGMLPGRTRMDSSALTKNDIELSASPTLPDPGQQPRARKLQFIPAKPQGSSMAHHQQILSAALHESLIQQPLFTSAKMAQTTAVEEFETDISYIPRAFTMVNDVVEDRRFSRITEENEDEEWDDDGSDEGGEELNYSDVDDEQNTTTQEIIKVRLDERPIVGAGDAKSFEQLLEEKLRQEEEKMKAGIQSPAVSEKKKKFLKKGEGISRFKGPPPKKISKKLTGRSNNTHLPHKTVENVKAKQVSSNQSSSDGEEGMKKGSVGSRLKTLSKSSSNLSAPDRKVVSLASKNNQPDPASKSVVAPTGHPIKSGHEKPARLNNGQQEGQTRTGNVATDRSIKSVAVPFDRLSKAGVAREEGPASLNLIRFAAQRKLEEQKNKLKEVPLAENSRIAEPNGQIHHNLLADVGRSPLQDSQSTHYDGDSTELDSLAEFELLEDAMDNMSFCSNSSIIKKLLTEDRQGQKEALQRIKLKNGFKRPAEVKDDVDSDDDTLREIDDVENAATTNYNNNNIEPGYLTSSSMLSNKILPENSGDARDAGQGVECLLSRTSHEAVGDIDFPVSPSKAVTRKIAPMTSRYNTASDTLSMLKALSFQAGILTSAPSIGDPKPTANPVTSHLNLPKTAVFTTAPSSSSQPENPKPTSQPIIPPQATVAKLFPPLSTAQVAESPFPAGNSAALTSQKSYDSQRYGVVSDDESSDCHDYNHYDETEESGEDEASQASDNERTIVDANHSEEGDKQANDYNVPVFDDESTWADSSDDDETCIKTITTSAPVTVGPVTSTPPTSKLVSRLFPKLKPKPNLQEEKQAQLLQQASAQPVQSEGVQSRILRDKLKELEVEIEKFRLENANLEKLRREREEGLAKLKQEIDNFQKEKENELKRIEEYKAEETKKLKKERKLFEIYQKKIRSMPDKKGKEEIECLRSQLQELQDEIKRKESRWSSSTSRLKTRLAELEVENGELREEIRILEKKRLEWMAAQSGNKASQVNGKTANSDKQSIVSPRSSTPTKEVGPAKSAYTLGSKESGSACPAATTSKMSAAALGPGNKKRNASQENGQVARVNGLLVQGLRSAKASAQNDLDIVSVESMQTENTIVPVMMDNTLPNSTQVSSMPGASSTQAKSAAMLAMEKAVVDKGDITSFKENCHPEGKVEKTFKNGAKEIHFPNGTVKEISADGQTIVCKLANGDIRQIFPDHRVVYIFAEAEILQTTFPDGLETFEFKNGQTEKRYPDGTVEIIFPSKDVKYLFPDGGQEVILTNGTVMQYNSKGERTVEYPSGDREVHTAEYQRREFPDGIIKTVYADGRHETRFPNGRVRLRDKAGNVIMDHIVHR